MFSTIWNKTLDIKRRLKELDVAVKNSEKKVVGVKTPYFMNFEFILNEDDLDVKEQPLRNASSSNIYLLGVSCDVYFEASGASRYVMDYDAQGFKITNGTKVFDFSWNFRLGSSNIMYAQDAQDGLSLLSRNSISESPTQPERLTFDWPLMLDQDEVLIFMLKPEYYMNPNNASKATTNKYYANVCFHGYRLLEGEEV